MNREKSFCSMKGCSQPPLQLLGVIASQSFTEKVAANSALGTMDKVEMVLGRPTFAFRRGFCPQGIRVGSGLE